jgi:predicted GIY-YIG superfamily endonuclease
MSTETTTQNFIYALKNPKNNEIFYVGQTWNLTQRLKKHIYDAQNNKGNIQKNEYINSLLAENITPIIEALETIPGHYNDNVALINERECFWVSQHLTTITNEIHEKSNGLLCLNCDKELSPGRGKRAKVFCSDRCRATYHQKSKKKKQPKYVRLETHEAVLKALNEAKRELADMKTRQIGESAANQRKTASAVNIQNLNDQPKSNYTINTENHPLWKPDDPRQNTMSFLRKYDCMTYAELEKLKK